MGILSRFKDIMASNFNALLDKMENPEKMIDQYLRNLNNDLAQVKAETASVMAEEKAAKRALDACDEEIAKMTDYARKAVAGGNDTEAKAFLNKKADLEAKRGVLEQQYVVCAESSMKMRDMHDKLCADIAQLNSRRDVLKAKIKVAETQQKVNKLTGAASATNNLSKFDDLEKKINKKIDEADAMAELNSTNKMSDINVLASKYDDGAKNMQVDAELAALKAEMGLGAEGGAQ